MRMICGNCVNRKKYRRAEAKPGTKTQSYSRPMFKCSYLGIVVGEKRAACCQYVEKEDE